MIILVHHHVAILLAKILTWAPFSQSMCAFSFCINPHKVPRLDVCRSIISLSKIVYQMWHDHSFSQRNKTTERAVFSQRNKTTERAVGVGLGGKRERGVG